MSTIVENLQREFGIIGRTGELTRTLVAAQAGKHILLEGPVGVGKTTIALTVASHLKRSFLRLDGDERYTEQKLAGWYDPPLVLKKGYTEESFIHGPLSTAMIEGRVLLINELNRMPEGTQNVLLSAMDERSIVIPKHGRVDAREGFLIIATQNPDEYIGTSQMSEALRDRFVCVSLVHQSLEEEREIVRLRSRAADRAVVDLSVAIARLTREDKEVRRGSSVRGAIDLADLFATAFGGFNDIEQNWVDYALPALATKIEINDHSEEKLAAVIKGLVGRALGEYHRKNMNGGSPPPGGEVEAPCRDRAGREAAFPLDAEKKK